MIEQIEGKTRSPEEWIGLFEGKNEMADRYLAEEIYTKGEREYIAEQKARFVDTLKCHKNRFGDLPCYLLRAPGRLNGFLEYLDMCAGDHMSTTIDGDIPMVLSAREDDSVVINNTLAIFPERTFSISEELNNFRSAPWGEEQSKGLEDNWDNRTRVHPYYGRTKGDHVNYCLASFLRLAWDNPQVKFKGSNITFGPSTIPLRAGTSSSSAIVVLSAYACLITNRGNVREPSLPELCNMLGEAEWYVGTHGGANDQTTILRNNPNGILYNRHSRKELDSTPLPFLKGVRIVLANTLWEANKTLGASYTFNLRKGWMDLGSDLLELVIEKCNSYSGQRKKGWVLELIKNSFNWQIDAKELERLDDLSWKTVKAGYKLFGSLDERLLSIPQEAIAQLIQLLPAEIDPGRAGSILGKNKTELERDYTLPDREGGTWRPRNAALFFNKENIIGHKLTCLFLEAQAELVSGVSPNSDQYKTYITRLSGLINEVQETIREDFMVSNEQIDLILEIACKGPGYLAGKLTGAGCGGCVCIFVKEDQADAMIGHLDRNYYKLSENFDNYRNTLASITDENTREEMEQNLKKGLADLPGQRRIVTFSRGAGVLKI